MNLPRIGQCLPVVLAAMLAGLPAVADTRLSYEDLLDHLINLDRLPAIEPGVYCRQFSSYDRASRYDEATGEYVDWDANGDAGRYLRIDPETQEGVMAEMEGPGCIFRIWSANPQGLIRFYLDGDTKPTYEWDFHKLFTGTVEPFITPLVWKRDVDNANSASNCYLPIPFSRSCKVTSVVIDKEGKARTPGHYYIIDYRVFPKDWQVGSFKLPLSAGQQRAVQQTARKWARPAAKGELDQVTVVEPGQTLLLGELNGPGVVTALRAKLEPAEKWATRKVVLRAYWDGEQNPSIDCPLGDFFGEPADAPYRSYPMGIAKTMNDCLFPMPFRKSARIVLINEGAKPARVQYEIAHRTGEVPENWAYFHAKYRQEKASTSFDYPLLEAEGTGKLVGICLFPDNIHGGWWGEGDEKVYVDGEKFPSWFGTGSEDYFGDAWGIRYFEHPSHGHPQKNVQRMQGCYRWHLGDNIPFYKSFRMTIENYAARERVKNDYYSVAYWYQMPGGSDFFEPVPVSERIPRGYVAAGAIEAEESLPPAASSGMTVIRDEELTQELSGGRGVKLTGKVGDSFMLSVPAPSEDRFVLEIATARDRKASRFDVLVGGTQKVGKYAYLRKGPNLIAIRFTGEPVEGNRCEVIIDYYRLHEYRNMITDWLWIGPFANPDGQGLSIEYPPEKELKLDARYEGREGVEVKWKPISKGDGQVALHNLFSPLEHAVIYATAVVNSPRSGKFTMLLGSDDGVKVWINGQQVWENTKERALAYDSDRFEVDLKQGANTILLKVEQRLGDTGFAARFLDPQDELSYSGAKK